MLVWNLLQTKPVMFVEHIVSKIVFYVIYQTRKTVFDHISKHREGS